MKKSKTFTWKTYRLAFLTSAIGAIWTLYALRQGRLEPWEDINMLDIVSEGVVLILTWLWVFLALHMRVNPKVNTALFTGFSLIFIASLQDFLDEFLDHTQKIFDVAESANPVGMLLATFGLFHWVNAYVKSNLLLKRIGDRYKRQSITDSMTELFNGRYLNMLLPQEIEKARTRDIPLSMVLLDIDHFKHHNDNYGHHEGDVVIRCFARVMRDCSRGEDLPFRYGGEEFLVLLPGADEAAAWEVAERIRIAFSKQVFEPNDTDQVQKTTSVGIATLVDGDDSDSIFRRADQALYYAKETGRNKTVRYSQLPQEKKVTPLSG